MALVVFVARPYTVEDASLVMSACYGWLGVVALCTRSRILQSVIGIVAAVPFVLVAFLLYRGVSRTQARAEQILQRSYPCGPEPRNSDQRLRRVRSFALLPVTRLAVRDRHAEIELAMS